DGALHWASEFTRLAVVWVVMLGSVVALDRGAHLSIGFIQQSLPLRWSRAVAAIAYLLSVAFVAALAWSGLVLSLATMRQVSPGLGIPMGYGYLALPAGAAMMTMQLVVFVAVPEVRRPAPD